MAENAGARFMEATKFDSLGPSDQQRGIRQPPLQLPHDASMPLIELPAPPGVRVGPVDLVGLIEQRQSLRTYAPTPLSLAELSYLLWCTQGVKEHAPGQYTLRTVPSAGARHALETYVLANRVEGLAPGLYRFLAIEHKLVEVTTGPQVADRAVEGCLGQRFVRAAAATWVWTAVPYRMTWRYGQRGYRYLHLDAGHVCQNLYLAAEAIGAGVCAIAAFDDDKMNALLGVDGERQFVIYIAAVGKKTCNYSPCPPWR
jgi:SagB-type dehydrogenase family enzyme